MSRANEADATLRAVERLAAVGVCVWSLELLVRRSTHRDSGLLSWSVAKLRKKELTTGPLALWFQLLFSYRGSLALMAGQLVCAAALVFCPLNKRQRAVTTTAIAW